MNQNRNNSYDYRNTGRGANGGYNPRRGSAPQNSKPQKKGGRGGENYGRNMGTNGASHQRRAAYGRGYGAYNFSYEERRKRESAETKRRVAVLKERERRLKQEMKIQNKKRRKKARKIFYGRFLVFLAVFAVLAIIFGIAFALYFNSSPDAVKKGSKVEYVIGGSSVRTVSYDTAFRNGKPYVCFNDIAKYLSMAVTGDASGMKFIIPDENSSDGAGTGNEETIKFFVDSRTVIINSQQTTLDVDSFLYGEEIWVSGDFVKEYIDGITFKYDPKKNLISISRIVDEEASDKENIVYRDVTLKIKKSDPIPGAPSEGGGKDATIPTATFSGDLSEYEQYMNPAEQAEYLLLVNTENHLEESYIPEDLTDVANTRQDGRETQKLRLAAAKSLEALFIEMNAAGYVDVTVTSGYRSYEYQRTLFDGYVQNETANNPALSREQAEDIVATYSSRPGTSEHQSGLCVDMHNLPGADIGFAEKDAYKWLVENAWKFGFILRYPEAKTDVTKISFEPWHWRFVGRENAYKIYSSSMCLEEYVASLNEN